MVGDKPLIAGHAVFKVCRDRVFRRTTLSRQAETSLVRGFLTTVKAKTPRTSTEGTTIPPYRSVQMMSGEAARSAARTERVPVFGTRYQT